MNRGSRPLSPHLQIYRPQLTSVLSITHRITGIVLGLGTLVLVYWVYALAGGPEAYASAQALLSSWFGRVVLFGFTFALFYHLCNGIRHLFWDAGYGYELDAVYASGKAVVAMSVVLTLVAWMAVYLARG
jgi:succinate dehydrogenase / fumarate reductase, cytochrome b subunit